MPITLPETITPGTLADAQEVQDNFDALAAAAANIAGDTFTGTINVRDVIPTTDAARDLGTALLRFRNIYISGSVIGPSATNAFGTVAVSGQSNVVADSASDTLTLIAGTGIAITTDATGDSVTITSVGATQAGTSAVNYKSGGILYNSQSDVGNVGSGEDTLISQVIAANVLASDGAALNFTLSGTFGSNGNTKRLKVKFGATTILDQGTGSSPNGVSWTIRGEIIRRGASSQLTYCALFADNTTVSVTNVSTAGETLSGAVTFAVTGEATSDNDIICKSFRLRYEPTSGN